MRDCPAARNCAPDGERRQETKASQFALEQLLLELAAGQLDNHLRLDVIRGQPLRLVNLCCLAGEEAVDVASWGGARGGSDAV